MGLRAMHSYWQRIRQLWLAVWNYSTLSPSLRLRRQVNQYLVSRPAMTLDEWHDRFWQPRQVSRDVIAFVYDRLPIYSGLMIDRVIPSDRLESDLHMTLVCWFDWQIQLCDDFCAQFGVDISSCLDQSFSTIEDLVMFLQGQRSLALHC